MVEHGGYGGSAAAPIARQVFDAWLLGKMPEGVGAAEDGEGDPPADGPPTAPEREGGE